MKPKPRAVVCEKVSKNNNPPDPPTYWVVSIPPKSVDRPVDPDGHAECIISSDDKKRLFDCPLFLTERVPQAKPNTINIKGCATGGLGMFAARDITYGELLFAERPLLVNPAGCVSYFYPVDGYTLEDHLKLASIEEEQQLEQAFRRMDDDKKDAYMALANSIKEDRSLSSIQQTNAFGFDLNELTRDGGVAPNPDELSRGLAVKMGLEPNMYCVTGKNASRMNHRWSLTLIHVNSYSPHM